MVNMHIDYTTLDVRPNYLDDCFLGMLRNKTKTNLTIIHFLEYQHNLQLMIQNTYRNNHYNINS